MQFQKILLLAIFLGLLLVSYYNIAAIKPEFSFGIVADIQYFNGKPHQTRYYQNSIGKLEDCVRVFNSYDLKLVVNLGDIIEEEFASYDSVMPVFNKIEAPKYHVLGNHEFIVKDRLKNSVQEKLGLTNTYYDFIIKSWRFIVLDGNDISLHRYSAADSEYEKVHNLFNQLKNSKTENIQTWNGAIGEAQLNWLKNKLALAGQKKEKVIIFCHFPVLPRDIHSLWNDEEVLKTIENYDCVLAYFNGHNHAGNYVKHNNIHYVTVQAMVETPDTSAFAIIEVYPNKLNIIGFGREPSRILPLKN